MIKKLVFATVAAVVLVHVLEIKSESQIRKRVVKLSSPHGMCSGEQVRAPSGVDYILTAAHCRVLEENGQITITDAEGHTLKRNVIAEDPKSDLLLLEGLPGLRGLDIASTVSKTEKVRTFTHGHNRDTYKTEGEAIQRSKVQVLINMIENSEQESACESAPKYKVLKALTPFGEIEACIMEIEEMASTAAIVPGSSGGPLVDPAGDLVGVASCLGDGFSYFVKLSDIADFLRRY